jgi:hypothetical protein
MRQTVNGTLLLRNGLEAWSYMGYHLVQDAKDPIESKTYDVKLLLYESLI